MLSGSASVLPSAASLPSPIRNGKPSVCLSPARLLRSANQRNGKPLCASDAPIRWNVPLLSQNTIRRNRLQDKRKWCHVRFVRSSAGDSSRGSLSRWSEQHMPSEDHPRGSPHEPRRHTTTLLLRMPGLCCRRSCALPVQLWRQPSAVCDARACALRGLFASDVWVHTKGNCCVILVWL